MFVLVSHELHQMLALTRCELTTPNTWLYPRFQVSGPFKIRVSSVVWLEFTTSGHQSTCRNMACALMVASGSHGH